MFVHVSVCLMFYLPVIDNTIIQTYVNMKVG